MSDENTAQGGELFAAVAPLTHVEVRDPSANPDNTWTMSGYAAVFNQKAVLLDSKFVKVEVELAADAFANVMTHQQFGSPDGVVHFNFGHDMNRAVAATDVPAGQPGSLQLATDAHGLRYLAKVSKDDPDGVALAVKMRDGVVRQASMAFVAGEQQFIETETADDEKDLVLRRILSVDSLFDVCATPQGVFSQTVSELQQFAAPLFGHPDAVALGGHSRQPVDGGGVSPVSGLEPGRTMKPRLSASDLRRIAAHSRR